MWLRRSCLLAGILAACSSAPDESGDDDDEPTVTGAGGSTSSSSASAGGAGGATSSSGISSSSASSTSGSGGGTPCPDQGVGEPNETEDTAFELKSSKISDCDGDGGMVSGTIAGANDIDWFTYEGDDQLFCDVDPTRSFTQSGNGLRLCKYVECVSAPTEVTCPDDTTPDTSPNLRDGCCDIEDFDLNVNCKDTSDEHTNVYIRIDRPGATTSTCNDYTLSYHY